MFAKNLKSDPITIEYAMDIAKLNEPYWHAVVFRNLPAGYKESILEEKLKSVNNQIKYVLPLQEIKSKLLKRATLRSGSVRGRGYC